MSDGALRIPITGDASQFKATLAEIESSLKYFKEKLKSAKGDQVAKINFTIAGLEESKTAITTFGKFAEGTLGALNQQISELSRKKLTIQADAAALAPINQELDRLIKKRDELNKAGLAQPIVEAVRPAAESIAGLRLRIQELNDLKILIDPKLNPSALAKINQEIDGLEAKLDNLDNLGTGIGNAGGAASKGLKKLEDQSKQSRIAVTNLALVLQDLPFGFIAIQNNLPNLQSSFANLKTTSDGTKNAFKAFAGALAGPGGFFLAFSAVTGAVTYAVQEYGSFSAAVDALFGKINPLKDTIDRIQKSYTEYNKQLQSNNEITLRATANQSGLIKTVELLSQKATDLSLSEKQRGAYLSQLKKIDEAYFGQLKTGASDVDAIKKATDAYTESLIANSTVKAYQSQLDAIEEQIAAQKTLREEFKESLKAAEQVKATTTKSFVDPTEKVNQDLGATATALDELYQKREKIVQGLNEAISGLKTVVKAPTGGANKNVFAFKIDTQDLDEAFNLDKIIANLTKYGNALIDVNNSEKERKNALRELMEINPEYFKGFDLNKKRVDELKESIETYIRTLLVEKKAREDSAVASKYNAEFRKNEEKGIKRLGDKYDLFADSVNSIPKDIDTAIQLSMQFDEIGNSTKKATQANNKFIESLKLGQDVIEILQKGLNLKESYDNAIEDLLNFSEYSRKEIEKIAKDLRFLQEPLEGLFTTLLEDGKVSWKSFADDVIKQIKRIAAALLSKAIIQGIANILAPGSGAIVSRGLKAIDTDILGTYGQDFSWLNYLPTGTGGRSANFGGVRGERAMAMTGQVNMVIRGNDLVGVMNRTNSTINRVG